MSWNFRSWLAAWTNRKPHDYVRWEHCERCYATFVRVNGRRPL